MPRPRRPCSSIRGVKTYYGKIIALKGVDLDVNQGEIVTLIGANGAGKSTLMMTIFGNPRAREGTVSYDGRDITRMATHEIARLQIAQSPEGRRIFPRMTVYENLQMGASINQFAHFDQDLERVFVMFPRLKERAAQRGGTLSGGEQQMLAIARALMSRPRLLLLDEPSLGLAPLIVRQIFDVIRDLNKTGRPDGVSRRAERLPRTEAGRSRLRHGQRPHHHVGHRQGPLEPARSAGRLSRGRSLMGILYSDAPGALLAFIFFTIVLGGLGGIATGRAFAGTWRSVLLMPLALIVMAAFVRFLHYALGWRGPDVAAVLRRIALLRRARRRLWLPVPAGRADERGNIPGSS